MKTKTYITIKDKDNVFRPRAILETDDKSGIKIVKEYVKIGKTEDTIVRVKLVEIEEIK